MNLNNALQRTLVVSAPLSADVPDEEKARLIAPVPFDRVRDSCGDGSSPNIGDIVELDQGFTFPDGRPGCMVYCIGHDDNVKWGADVYEPEVEILK